VREKIAVVFCLLAAVFGWWALSRHMSTWITLIWMMITWRVAADWADRRWLIFKSPRELVALAKAGALRGTRATDVMAIGSIIFGLAAFVYLFV
jgi:hypothetical protein